MCTISAYTHRGHWGHRAGTPLCTLGQLHKVAVAPTEHLWVAPSTGQHLTAHRAVGSPSAPCWGSCPAACRAGLATSLLSPCARSSHTEAVLLPQQSKATAHTQHTDRALTDTVLPRSMAATTSSSSSPPLGLCLAPAAQDDPLGRIQVQSVPEGRGTALGMGLALLHGTQPMVGCGSVGITSSVPLGMTGGADTCTW